MAAVLRGQKLTIQTGAGQRKALQEASPDVTVGYSTLNERTLDNWQDLQANHDMQKENEVR